MYKLRSTRTKPTDQSTDLIQTTLAFRKRRRPTVETCKAINQEPATISYKDTSTTFSPPKKTKMMSMTSSDGSSKCLRTLRPRIERIQTPNKPSKRSPLKDINAKEPSAKYHETQSLPVNDMTTPTKTPIATAKSVMKRLHFKDYSAVNEVKRALHNSLPTDLHCRESQLTTLTNFMSSHVKKKTPGSLYISGPPGTGKTACLNHILSDGSNSELFKQATIITVNCMSVKRPQAIYSKIADQLLGQSASKVQSSSSLQTSLVKYITSTHKMIILVLDEVDQLDCRGQDILYTIFEWPALQNSKLLLIGIANALDLTDRVLPRLKSLTKCRPTLMHFPPYTKDEIALIINARLNEDTTIEPMAVQFAARKVAAVHGDVRKALDICRRAIELVETEQLKLHSQETTLKVTLRHIATVISEVYSSSITAQTAQQILPLQQKITVCVLLCMVKRHTKQVNIGKLYDAYVKVCRLRSLKYESESEFIGVCDMLETRGIIALKKAKENRMTKVILKLNQAELEYAIQDKVLLSSILEHGIPSS